MLSLRLTQIHNYPLLFLFSHASSYGFIKVTQFLGWSRWKEQPESAPGPCSFHHVVFAGVSERASMHTSLVPTLCLPSQCLQELPEHAGPSFGNVSLSFQPLPLITATEIVHPFPDLSACAHMCPDGPDSNDSPWFLPSILQYHHLVIKFPYGKTMAHVVSLLNLYTRHFHIFSHRILTIVF